MELIQEPLPGLFHLKPSVFQDERGYFFESFNREKLAKLTGKLWDFVQDNESCSQANVVRGLHFQAPPSAQAKLVRVIKGRVLDVALDIRKGSPTYGQHFAVELSEQNKEQLLVPEGFAHGFCTLEDDTIFCYKCSDFYNKQSEKGLRWNDAKLSIQWPIHNPILSEKDQKAPLFSEFESPFDFLQA